MTTKSLSNSYAKERKTYYIEKKNPLLKIITLMNNYHAIDSMYATPEEKQWAKDRLETQILGILKHASKSIHSSVKASFKNKVLWEETRDYLA